MVTKLWEKLVSRYKRKGTDINVSWYQLTLGSQHATTGIYAKSYASAQTKEMIVVVGEAMDELTSLGLYTENDALGLSQFIPEAGDKIKDSQTHYYMIDAVYPYEIGDLIFFYVNVLTRMPFHE